MRFQMDVNGVPPAATTVDQCPFFGNPKGNGVVRNHRVKMGLVDQPHSIAAAKLERTTVADLRGQDRRMPTQKRIDRDAVAGGGSRFGCHHDLHDPLRKAGGADGVESALGTRAFVLFGGVDQIQLGTGRVARKIHHHIGPLGRRDGELVHLDGVGRQPGVIAHPQMGLHDAIGILNAEVPDAGRRSAQQAHPNLGLLNHQIGIGLAIDEHDIAEVAIRVVTNRKAVVEE